MQSVKLLTINNIHKIINGRPSHMKNNIKQVTSELIDQLTRTVKPTKTPGKQVTPQMILQLSR